LIRRSRRTFEKKMPRPRERDALRTCPRSRKPSPTRRWHPADGNAAAVSVLDGVDQQRYVSLWMFSMKIWAP
jgi:hypothetical protein